MSKIIIAAPPFTNQYGGIVVLHKFSHILNEIGYDSYLIDFTGSGKSITLNPNFNTKNINKSLIDCDNDIIVYPEITIGNPYNIKKCVRYILYYNEKRNVYHTWGNDDFWIYYRNEFYDSIKELNLLTIYDTKVNYFKNLNLQRNIKSSFLIKKGNDYRHISKVYHPTESIELRHWVDDSYLLNFFNNCQNFYSYDYNTYINVIAALCGCNSIIVPIKNVDIQSHNIKNPDRLNGISYGIDDIRDQENVDVLRTELINKEINQKHEVDVMFKKILNHFYTKNI